MSETPVGKRRFHAFLSHAHVDKDQADHLLNGFKTSLVCRSGTTLSTCLQARP
jgi:hypothetical protein